MLKRISTYFPEAAWDGWSPMKENKYGDQIEAIRKRGGDVIISFGGAGGHEVALEAKDPVELEGIYQSVIDQYHFTWLDFDVEGGALDKHPEASVRRNIAILALQKKKPGLVVSFTLPVDPNGISDQSQRLLADAVGRVGEGAFGGFDDDGFWQQFFEGEEDGGCVHCERGKGARADVAD